MGLKSAGLGVTTFLIAVNHAGIQGVTWMKSEWGTAGLLKMRSFGEERWSAESFSYHAGPRLRLGSAALRLYLLVNSQHCGEKGV